MNVAVATNFVPTVWIVQGRFARAAPPAYDHVRHEVDRRRALLTTPIVRAAVNQFLLVRSAGLGSLAMGVQIRVATFALSQSGTGVRGYFWNSICDLVHYEAI